MDVFSKELVYKKGQKYKAYLLFETTAVDVATLGFTELIDIETTKGTDYSSIPCRYVILNGKLFYSFNQKFRQVNNWTTWTYISGNYNNNSNALGIADGKLYIIYTSNEIAFTVTQMGNLTTWTKISGYNSNYVTYGIVDGKLYKCSGTSQSQVSTGSNWTDITGYSTGSRVFAYGIRGGRLRSIGGSKGTTVTTIGSLTAWTKISGYSIGTLGIADGKLYRITGSSQATQIGNLTTWTKISSSGAATTGYGIADGKLYRMTGSSQTAQVGTLTNWTDISGFYDSSQCAYGIAGNKLYYLSGGSATQLLNSKCLAVFGAGSANYSALAICEV